MPRDPWYTVVTDEELNQGDLITDCPIIMPAAELPAKNTQSVSGSHVTQRARLPYPMLKKEADIVVMTQSCDLTNQKAALVLVCPHYSLLDAVHAFKRETTTQQFTVRQFIGKLKDQAQSIRGGKTAGRYMLAPCSLKTWKDGIRIVDFERTISIPYDYLKLIAVSQKRRLRIKSPYREHLSQAFATYFMRVALDAVISKDLVNAEIDELQKQFS